MESNISKVKRFLLWNCPVSMTTQVYYVFEIFCSFSTMMPEVIEKLNIMMLQVRRLTIYVMAEAVKIPKELATYVFNEDLVMKNVSAKCEPRPKVEADAHFS